jgi:hypothetical protein
VAVLSRGALAGHHRLTAATSIEELRSFYFRETAAGGEGEE